MVGPDVNMGRSNPYPPSIRFGHIQEISWFLVKIHLRCHYTCSYPELFFRE